MQSKSVTTSFAEATKVTPISRKDSHFEAKIPWDWCGGMHAHGGYVTSLLFSTARAYFLTKHPSRSQTDPINIHVQFLLPVPVGVARLRVDEIKIGDRYSTLQITILNAKGSSHQPCVTAIITQGNLAKEIGQTITTPPARPKKEIPNREMACEEWKIPHWLAKLLPVSTKWQISILKGAKNQRFLSRKGLNVKDIWVRWADQKEKLDVISLGVMCDNFFSAPTNFYDNFQDLKQYVYPTLCMSVEVKKDPGYATWLFEEVICNKIQNGRFDQEVYLLDEEGDLVALSKHVCLAVPLKRGKEKTTCSQTSERSSKL